MLSLLPLFLFGQFPIAELDALAQARDVAGLTPYLADSKSPNPFNILKTGGGYAMGSKGWHAKLLEPVDGSAKYVVFTTPTLVEDAGELLFRVNSTQKLEFIPERDSFGMRLDSHSFNVTFDLPKHVVNVTDTIRGSWTTAPKPHFMFRVSPTFNISAINLTNGTQVPFSQAGGVVAVSSTPSDSVFTVKYSGTVDKPGFANVVGPDEATLSGTMWYPMIARRPTTYDISLHIPQNWLALAQGSEVSSTVAGNERITKYQMNLPVVWISATAGPYHRVSDVINGIEYATISETAKEDAMHKQNEGNAEVVEFYSKTFGRYPYKTWTTIDSMQFRNGVGALEGYSFATYPAGRMPFQDSHEPAHTWWGGIINNDYLASIWNESFADYSQVIFNRDRPMGNLEERQKAYVGSVTYTPLFDEAPLAKSGQDIGPAATALGYLKGAYVLQVLEDEIGTPAMLRSMKEWIRTNPSAHVGCWEDFEAVVDRVTGKDYTWFFDQWVRSPGLPKCALTSWKWSSGKFFGEVTFSGKPYRFTTDAVLEYLGNRRKYTRVKIDPASGGRFTIDTPEKPIFIALDPWLILPRHDMPKPPAISIQNFSRNRVFVDPQKPETLKPLVSADHMDSLPGNLDGVFIAASPESLPAIKPIFENAGFHISNNHLTYKGTTIDLTKGGAIAVADLPEGHHCLIGVGTCDKRPNFGRARLAVFDAKGNVLRAETDPVEAGSLAINLTLPDMPQRSVGSKAR